MMKKNLCLGIVGCPAGLYVGSTNLKQDLNIGESKDLGTNEIDSIEKIWKNQQKTILINKDTKITVTQLDDGKYGKKVKVGINCMNGDLIGWGNNFWAGGENEKLKNEKMKKEWNAFKNTFEAGIKGYLNLIFGCNYREAIESADSGEWYNKEILGNSREDIARVGIVSRMKNPTVNNINENQSNERESERNKFEDIWNNIFGGRTPFVADKKTSITNTVIEVWVHKRDEFKVWWNENKIQPLIRRSIARSLIKIILGAKWCTKKNWNLEKCEQESNYQANQNLSREGFQENEYKEFRLDGQYGFTWNPGNNGRGKPDWTWQKLKEWTKGSQEWWKNVRDYLGQISNSAFFYSSNKNLAKVLVTEIFKEIVGQQRFEAIKFQKRDENCKIGRNGLICFGNGLVWRK
ncbi:hypothetical protein [Mycoplasma parvum]|uniref:Uncharacterized protein n=1 Tax=Mycoplasma parvum str. Indiana TaxID=1403316 RepID=U5NCG8_9MOLU|nr:hypothetical protein [Mycoplasma parvum]AGX89122.1 hypothetical protein PRV_01920 [Mycoplasma parvum str. Indiana]